MRSLFGGDGALVEIEERFPHFGRNEGLSAGLEKTPAGMPALPSQHWRRFVIAVMI
jgi:hypothetical protein